MSTTPPDQPEGTPLEPSAEIPSEPQPEAAPPPPPDTIVVGSVGYGGIGGTPTSGAILPVPGNAELAVYVLAAIILAIIWAASSLLNAGQFATLFTLLTVGYIVSRGIAKASRVLEQ
ncbi:MAG TPA: hypothetical protein VH416_04480 [Gaiellaceae bacterium]|jgi:hypothetical protein